MQNVTLYPGLNTPLWLDGLTDSSSGTPVSITSATISVTLLDQFGNSLGPYAYSYIAGSQTAPNGTVYPAGNWQAQVPPNAAILPSSLYLGTISITIGGVTQFEYFEAASRYCSTVYCDSREWERYEGMYNIKIFSDKDDAGSFDMPGVLSAMLWADTQINEYYTGPTPSRWCSTRAV